MRNRSIDARFGAPVLLVPILALGLGCSSGGGDSSQGSSASHTTEESAVILEIDCVGEPRAEWTWAAAAGVVLELLEGSAPETCVIVSELLTPDCCNSPDTCNSGATPWSTQQALSIFGDLDSVVTPPISFDALRIEIDAGRPVIASYSNSFLGHVVVIYGYDDETEEIWLCDTFYGDFVLPYGHEFFYANPPFAWGTTILKIQ